MKNSIKAIFLFLFCLIIIALFWKNNILLTILLSVSLISILILYHKKKDLITIFAAAMGGSLGELILIYLGIWSYTNPTLLNIPLWLPLAWAHVGIILTLLQK